MEPDFVSLIQSDNFMFAQLTHIELAFSSLTLPNIAKCGPHTLCDVTILNISFNIYGKPLGKPSIVFVTM